MANVGIIGAGAVGLATASYLTSNGHNVSMYKRIKNGMDEDFLRFKDSVENNGVYVDASKVKGFDSGSQSFYVTSNVQELKSNDLILVCVNYTAHKDIGRILADNSINSGTPVIAFPGKVGSSILLNYNDAGEVSSSLFGTSHGKDSCLDSPIIEIKNKKSGLYFFHKNEGESACLNSMLNRLFGENSFQESKDAFHIGLQNHDYGINLAAVVNGYDLFVENNGEEFRSPLYVLGNEACLLFEENFKERKMVANNMGLNITTIEHWLDDRDNKSSDPTVIGKLADVYNKYEAPLSKDDRRLSEDLSAMYAFKEMATSKNIVVPATDELIRKTEKLRCEFGLESVVRYSGKDFGLN